MLHIIFLILFFADYGLHLYGTYLEHKKLRWVTKPLLLPFIIVVYISGAFPDLNILLIIGLIFGWLGDIFLMIDREEKWFILGLGSFLMGHIFYIIIFLLSIPNLLDFSFLGILYLIPAALIALYVLYRIKGKMGDMTKPVLIYMGVIFLMGLSAVLRYAGGQEISFFLVLIGSILFIISDGLIALDKFHKEIDQVHVYIMATYAIAQFCIAYGFIV
ncbi:MAG: lysoplasmalogenase [Promethearchaeia archaeon]